MKQISLALLSSFVILSLIGFQQNTEASPKGAFLPNYPYFFSNYNNVFSLDPSIAKDLFFELVSLSGNKKQVKKKINREIFSCKRKIENKSYCRDLKKSSYSLKEKIILPLVAKNVTSYTIEKKKKQKRLSFHWQPRTWHPPNISIDMFLAYLGAAKDSKFYQFDEQIQEIRLISNIPRRIDLIIERKLADNIVDLYKNSFITNDQITIFLDGVSFAKEEGTLRVTLHFKVKQIQINNLLFDAEPDNLL